MKNSPEIKKHNQYQVEYYNNTRKKTMQPAHSAYISDQIKQFLDFSKLQPHDEIIEIGCGIGKYTFHLLEKGYNIEGLDLSSFLLQEFEKHNNNKYQIKLYNTDVLNAPGIINKNFDVAIGFMVLHHLHDLEQSFTAISKLLKNNGKLVFFEPNAWNPLYYFQVTFTKGMTWKSEKGLINMRKSIFTKAMLAAGYKNIEIRRFGFFPPIIKNSKMGNTIELFLSKFRFLDFFRPFQIIIINR